VFSALADESRRKSFVKLSKGSMNVNEIAGKFKISRPAISKNLRILVDSRLVRQLTGCVSQLISPVLVPVWSPEI